MDRFILTIYIHSGYFADMKHGNQKRLAEKAGLSPQFFGKILNRKRRPSWKNAKRLAKVTGTTPDLWLDAKSKEEIEAQLNVAKLELDSKHSLRE